MKNNTNKYFKTVSFSNLILWDVKRYSFNTIKSQYPIVKLGLHIQEESHKIKLFDFPDDEFGILGVNNKTGIFDAYKEKGSNINQAYKKMEKGWLAYNPYRVNVGSIGLRTEEHENEFISPAYVVFSCRETLLPDFLFKLFKMEIFNRIINASTTGSVRQNLTIDILKSLDIPLPPIEIQKNLLEIYYQKQKEIAYFNSKIKENQLKIEQIIENELCLKFPEIKAKKLGMYFSHFSEVSRWDVWINGKNGRSEKYKNGTLQEVVIGNPMYGANVKSQDKKTGIRYIRITDINEDGTLNDNIVSAEKVERKYLLKENDFLIARSGNTVGKTFLYKNKIGKAIFAGYLVKYILNTKKIIPEYLLYFTKSRLYKNWITSNQRISGQPNINGQEYLSSPIVIPPIEIQSTIVDRILKINNEIVRLKSNIEKNINTSINEIENRLFKS
ncbi:restriction endonuclease subunit S [Otariodibacter oris]|uniref:restriction endonuclease subunit S n=1 Tax=Otariodibacter oris TaxID=1032623 RepID=UPI001B862721|nr:restriction endonuclease subunit S [Otariodibacter oris]